MRKHRGRATARRAQLGGLFACFAMILVVFWTQRIPPSSARKGLTKPPLLGHEDAVVFGGIAPPTCAAQPPLRLFPEPLTEGPQGKGRPTPAPTVPPLCHRGTGSTPAMKSLSVSDRCPPLKSSTSSSAGVAAPHNVCESSDSGGKRYAVELPDGRRLLNLSAEALRRTPLTPGWLCVATIDRTRGCAVGAQAFVFEDRHRGGSEYGVRPTTLPSGGLPFIEAGRSSETTARPSSTTAFPSEVRLPTTVFGQPFYVVVTMTLSVPVGTPAISLLRIVSRDDGTLKTGELVRVQLVKDQQQQQQQRGVMGLAGAVDTYGGLGSALWVDDTIAKPASFRGERPLAVAVAATLPSVTFFHPFELPPISSLASLRTALHLSSRSSPLFLHVIKSFVVQGTVNIPEGTTVALDPGVIVTVEEGATLQLDGIGAKPVVMTRAKPTVRTTTKSSMKQADVLHQGNWGGITVQKAGRFVARHAWLAFGGGATTRAAGTGTHIKDACPVVVAEAKSYVQLHDSAVLHSTGPGFGAGDGAQLHFRGTLFHDLAQGGECVGCSITIEESAFAHIPASPNPTAFVDKDNDGLYFRGGHATVHRSVVAWTKDDCVDTASSKGDPNESTLAITESMLLGCQHEGLALSASVGTRRHVKLEDSLVGWAQQGVENGYTPASHTALVSRTTFRQNELAVRYGDNYKLAIRGQLHVSECRFEQNHRDALSVVKQTFRHGRAGADDGNDDDDTTPALFIDALSAESMQPSADVFRDVGKGHLCGSRHWRPPPKDDSSMKKASRGAAGGCSISSLC